MCFSWWQRKREKKRVGKDTHTRSRAFTETEAKEMHSVKRPLGSCSVVCGEKDIVSTSVPTGVFLRSQW